MKLHTQLTFAVVVALGASPVLAAKPKPGPSADQYSAAEVLKRVLHGEEKGDIGDRLRRLKSAGRTAPNYAPLQWQSGKLQVDGKWVRFDQAARFIDDNGLTQQYRKVRAKTKLDLKGHLHLAAWCKRHGMTDRRRSHLTAALEKSPNHPAARKALGYVRIGGEWILRSELAKRQKDAVVARKNLLYWLPRIQSIRMALLGSNVSRRLTALKQLDSIDKPEAADAIELGLGWHSSQMSGVAVKRLAEIKHPFATLSLARLAVASPWKSTREAAAKQLKTKKFDHFVPQLLSITRTPVRSRRLLYMRPNGSMLYRHAFYQEGRTGKRIAVADHFHHLARLHRSYRLAQRHDPGSGPRPADIRISSGNDGLLGIARRRLRANNDSLQTIGELAQRRKAAEDEENRVVSEVNGRVRNLIGTISGREFGKNPRELWDWWESYSEVWQPDTKPIDYRYQRSNSYQVAESYDVQLTTYIPGCSCLVAGTPVWTERGLIAIDKVRIGDRVLSKNEVTGELAYKPVLKTTVRPAVPLMKLEIGTRTISLTMGHPFWISGRGWMKARDIRKGMYMHDVTGTTAVQPAGTAKPAKTYNLIVADFHTYFVGESKVLSHDNTPIEPTAALVPGLVRR